MRTTKPGIRKNFSASNKLITLGEWGGEWVGAVWKGESRNYNTKTLLF